MNETEQRAPWRIATRLVASIAEKLPPKFLHTVIGAIHRRAEPLLPILVSRCPEDGVFVDVGAWRGPWSYALSRKVKAVHAFEPNPQLAADLRRSVRANVTVHEVAASGTSGTAELRLSESGFGSEGTATLEDRGPSSKVFSVSTVRLDDLALEDVALVKVDVEGHEFDALSGFVRTISNCHPVIVVELESQFGDFSPTLKLLQDMGYVGKVHSRGEWTDVDDFDLAGWQGEHAAEAPRSYLREIIRGGHWVNNVVWAHPRSRWSPWQ